MVVNWNEWKGPLRFATIAFVIFCLLEAKNLVMNGIDYYLNSDAGESPTVEKWKDAALSDLAAELNNDDNYRGWGEVATVIAIRNEPESGEIIREFITARDRDGMDYMRCASKVGALMLLGLTNSDADNEFLLKAYSEEGAKELIANWIGYTPTEVYFRSGDNVMGVLRGRAAVGLALTQRWSNRRFLEKENVVCIMKTIPTLAGRDPMDDYDYDSDTEMYGFLLDAFAVGDIIDDMGRKRYKRMMFGSGLGDMMIHRVLIYIFLPPGIIHIVLVGGFVVYLSKRVLRRRISESES
jgi:hypothetical protein